jgi:hypothetical protein
VYQILTQKIRVAFDFKLYQHRIGFRKLDQYLLYLELRAYIKVIESVSSGINKSAYPCLIHVGLK